MGFLSRPYLSAHAKVTTRPPHSISHTSAAFRQNDQARVCIHFFWDEQHTSSRLQRSIFFPPSPFKGDVAQHTVFTVQPSSCTQPPPSSQRSSQVLFKCIHQQQSQLFHGYGRVPPSCTRTKQLTAPSESATKLQAQELDQTALKPPNLVPGIRQVCK